MNVRVFRGSCAQCSVVCVFLLLSLGCSPRSLAAESATLPPSSETSVGEHDQITQPERAPDLLAEDRSAYERARPIFQQYCARCHTTTGDRASKNALGHFNMNDYPFGGHHHADIAQTIREVLGATGKKATMPRNDPGVVRGEDLALILDWADSFDRAEAAGLHAAPGQHDHAH